MNQLKWMVALGALIAAGLGGCKVTDEKVTYPDGTVSEHIEFELRPNFLPILLNYDVRDIGKTSQGLPIREWAPKLGSETMYEVEGVFYAKKHGTQPPALSYRQEQSATDEEEGEAESVQSDEFRISADFFGDSAQLLEQFAGSDSWQVIVSGDVQTVAKAALRRGLGAMDFDNEFGAWSIRVDSPIPVVVTRLNGEIIDVRGVGQFGKPNLETNMIERCR